MAAPSIDLLGAFGLRPDQIEARPVASRTPRPTGPRKAATRNASRARKDRGRSYVCTDEVLAEAHRMHLDGLSAREIARRLFDRCFSASEKALAMALLSAWHGRGWEVRDNSRATALANVQRVGAMPQCEHVHGGGPLRGERCGRRVADGGQWCFRHRPEVIAAGIARLRNGAPS